MLLGVVMASLSSCATINGLKERRALKSLTDAEEANLIDRAEQRWEALIAFDIPRVHSFATPAYREIFDAEHMYAGYANNIRRTRAEIQSVVFEQTQPPLARISTNLYFEYALEGQPAFESFNPVNEVWIKRDGEWWYIEPR